MTQLQESRANAFLSPPTYFSLLQQDLTYLRTSSCDEDIFTVKLHRIYRCRNSNESYVDFHLLFTKFNILFFGCLLNNHFHYYFSFRLIHRIPQIFWKNVKRKNADSVEDVESNKDGLLFRQHHFSRENDTAYMIHRFPLGRCFRELCGGHVDEASKSSVSLRWQTEVNY